MKKAHVNTVTLGVFSWSTLEPQEGVFELDWLADIIHNLYANGIYTTQEQLLAITILRKTDYLLNIQQRCMEQEINVLPQLLCDERHERMEQFQQGFKEC